MKIIQHDNGVVFGIIGTKDNVNIENIAVVDEIPPYIQKSGFSGVLKYSEETGLYWDYVENPPNEDQELSAEEALDIILGGETA
jgi:hypothetical protein